MEGSAFISQSHAVQELQSLGLGLGQALHSDRRLNDVLQRRHVREQVECWNTMPMRARIRATFRSSNS